MKNAAIWTLLIAAILGIGLAWRAKTARFDVVFDGGTIPMDNLNLPLPILAAQLPQNPGARSFLVTYRVLPNPAKPLETLPHSLEYFRDQKRLDWHRDNIWFDRYDNISDAVILKVAKVKGGVNKLRKAGCVRTKPQETQLRLF